MSSIKIAFACLASLVLLDGCQSYEKRTYDVSVKNAGAGPITVWLTKDGEPYEYGWLSPEDVVIESPKEPKKEISGVVIPPGKTAETGQRLGRFKKETHAILRIYDGQLGIDKILATHPGPSRVDLILQPGRSAFVVKSTEYGIDVQPTAP
jgi:hypothetical protein